ADDSSTPAERREAAAVVSRATARMTRLLEDLLATARKRSAAFVDRELDLAELARTVAGGYRPVADERSLGVELRVHDGPTVYGDPESLERAVSNLLSNAVRLAPAGSMITIGTGSRAGWAWIAVRDEGPGIAEQDQERVFDRFHRGTGEAARSTRGSGLGLAIARQIAESHEGRLVLFSRFGVGSTFVLWLPDRSLAPDRGAVPPDLNPLPARGSR